MLPMILSLLLATPVPQPGHEAPSYLKAKDLLARCSRAEGWDYCYGYVVSVYDTVRAHEAWLKVKEMCVPRGTTQGELVDTVVRYLQAHPDEQDSQAASVAVVALQQRFLCGDKGPQSQGH